MPDVGGLIDELRRQPWELQAACRGLDQNLWFTDTAQARRQARHICQSCPVRHECIQLALDTGQEYGMWGGLTASQLRKARR